MEEVLPPGAAQATARLLVESGVARPRTVRFAGSKTAVALNLAFDWMMPGQFEAFGYRKAFCERQVRAGIQDGATQVLALGAGFDTLGWRVAPEFPRVRFFEIDHPATACHKAKGIESMGERANLHLLAEDLGERRLADVLEDAHDWDTTAQTVVVAEGLLMYLPSEAVGALFEHCAARTGARSQIAFSYVEQRSNGRPDAGPWTGLVLWSLKLAGERWLWSLPAGELESFLSAHGWRIEPAAADGLEKRGIERFAVAVK